MDEHLRNKVLVFMLMSLYSLEEGERNSLCIVIAMQHDRGGGNFSGAMMNSFK